MNKTKACKVGLCLMAALLILPLLLIKQVSAEEITIKENDVAIGVSPMQQDIILNPEETHHGELIIINPSVALHDIYYKITIEPFFVDENYNYIYNEHNDNNQITDWITLESPDSGSIHPNDTATIKYKIDVPKDAPAGGQYASITVSTDFAAAAEAGVNINEAMSISHIILAEIKGETIETGEILEANIKNSSFGGKIQTHSMVKNTGNVHGTATYTTTIKPLFSNDPAYDNTQSPETHYILPGRTYYNETAWEETPTIGIFNVEYTVDFQGQKQTATKLVIICPWWLLFSIAFLLIAILIRIIVAIKRKFSKKKSAAKN